jgi:hypothetical protein
MRKIIERIVLVSFIPITFMSIFGGVVGGIWLLIIGEWKLVVLALIVDFAFPFIVAPIIFLLITAPMMALVNRLEKENKKTASMIVGWLNLFINHMLYLAWVFIVFVYMLTYATERDHNVIPYLLFGWEVAVGPFQYMASKGSSAEIASQATSYLNEVAYLILFLFYLLNISSLALPVIFLIMFIIEVFIINTAIQMRWGGNEPEV